MNLSFHRSTTVGLKISKPGEVRAFVFEASVGFTKDPVIIDPLSGMLVSLVEVDELLAQLKNFLASRAWPSFESVLNEAVAFIQALSFPRGISLCELLLQEKRGFFIGWKAELENIMGSAEILDLDQQLFKITSTFHFNESKLFQKMIVSSKESLLSGQILQGQPNIISMQVEDLATSEQFQFRP